MLSKNARYKGGHATWFFLHDILEQTQLIHGVRSQKSDGGTKGAFWGGEDVPSTDLDTAPMLYMFVKFPEARQLGQHTLQNKEVSV